MALATRFASGDELGKSPEAVKEAEMIVANLHEIEGCEMLTFAELLQTALDDDGSGSPPILAALTKVAPDDSTQLESGDDIGPDLAASVGVQTGTKLAEEIAEKYTFRLTRATSGWNGWSWTFRKAMIVEDADTGEEYGRFLGDITIGPDTGLESRIGISDNQTAVMVGAGIGLQGPVGILDIGKDDKVSRLGHFLSQVVTMRW